MVSGVVSAAGEGGTMKAMVAVDGVCTEVEREMPVAGEGEVVVRVRATSVNRADTLQRRGKYSPPPGATDVLGLELAGEVVSLGGGVESVKVGDRVMALVAGGGNAEFAAVAAGHLIPVPDALSWAEAGAIPETFLTAFQLLRKVGSIKAGDVVVVYAAGSGVGTAALQLIRAMGAKAIAVAGSDTKLERATALGAVATVNYKTSEDWPAQVQAALDALGTGGAHLVMDCVGSSFAAHTVSFLRTEGHWVVYGLMGGIEPPAGLFRDILRKRLKIEGTTLRARSDEYKADLVSSFSAFAFSAIADKSITPIIHRTFDGLSSLQEAHELVESNTTNGKVVLLL